MFTLCFFFRFLIKILETYLYLTMDLDSDDFSNYFSKRAEIMPQLSSEDFESNIFLYHLNYIVYFYLNKRKCIFVFCSFKMEK